MPEKGEDEAKNSDELRRFVETLSVSLSRRTGFPNYVDGLDGQRVFSYRPPCGTSILSYRCCDKEPQIIVVMKTTAFCWSCLSVSLKPQVPSMSLGYSLSIVIMALHLNV